MQVRLWDGASAKTEMFSVKNPVEWSLLCSGQKVEMRTTKKLLSRPTPAPRLVMGSHGDSFVPFVFLGAEQQVLGAMTDADARAEGMADLESFKDHWMRTLGNAYFPVHERVMCHKLRRFEGEMSSIDEVDAVMRLVRKVYPLDLA